MSQAPSRHPRVAWPLVVFCVVAGAVAALLVSSKEMREWFSDSLKTIFVIVTTPFILEATVAALGILILLAYNRWRLMKEGDGWVYLVDQSEESGHEGMLPKALTERLHNVILKDKPEGLGETEDQARRSVIEGFLELGMGAQALEEFESNRDWPEDGDTARLRVRVLAANADTAQAQTALRQSVERFHKERTLFAITALDVARWCVRHSHRTDLAKLWLAEATELDAAAAQALAADDPLKQLALV